MRILHLLGIEGPKTLHPTKYIRYIYNRVVLENAIVRAAAVAALAKFGVGQSDPEVKRSVNVLLTRCLDDTDDEVRDRAALNLRLMTEEDEMANRFIKNGEQYNYVSPGAKITKIADSMFSLSTFEHQLVMYVTADDKATFAAAFDMSKVPIVSHEQALAEEKTKKLTSATPTLKAPSTGPKKTQANGTAEKTESALAAAQKHAEALMQIPELKAHGQVLSSSSPVELTESETEYVVTAIKHIYQEHIVIQYDIKNTLASTVLEDVSFKAEPEDEEALEEEFLVPVSRLSSDEQGTVFVSFKKVGDSPYPVTSFTNTLKFTSKEIDPSSGEPDDTGYEDEYQTEDLELVGSDYVLPAFAGSFEHAWEQTGANGEEATETLVLGSIKSIAGTLVFQNAPVLCFATLVEES